jgi:thiamine-monophosphate kinase
MIVTFAGGPESGITLNEALNSTKEQRLIAAIKDWTGERLIGDDCAILPGGGLVTADTLVEGTHFLLPGIAFEDLGWKALSVNLSDIAAMAGRPRFAVVSLVLPDAVSEKDVEKLYLGMLECARTYRCRIVGGDLTRGQQVVISITVMGDTHEQGVMARAGAQAGDIVIATGHFGASAAGLWLMKDSRSDGFDSCRQQHVHPLPRLCESWSLVRQTAGRGALMDASDGLADALIQIARASNVSIIIDEAALPLAADTRQVAELAGVDPMEWALYGGEDYELVAAVRPTDWQAMQKAELCAFSVLGTVQPGSGVVVKRQGGQKETLGLERAFRHW